MNGKDLVCFMAVQVVSRYPNGQLKEWYDGDERGSLQEAKEEARLLANDFPGTEYQVIERRITSIGKPVKRWTRRR